MPSMKAAQKDKMQRGRKKKISLGFLHWHEMAAFLLTASSHASCWHYTSCAVDPPPCWCLPNRIISCVTAVVAELLALQIWEHHFSLIHAATGHTTRHSGLVCGTLSAALLCLTFCEPDGLFSPLGIKPLSFTLLISTKMQGWSGALISGLSPTGLLRRKWPKNIWKRCFTPTENKIFWSKYLNGLPDEPPQQHEPHGQELVLCTHRQRYTLLPLLKNLGSIFPDPKHFYLQKNTAKIVSIEANRLIKRKKRLPKPPQLVMGLQNAWTSSTDNTATGMFSLEHLQSHMKLYFRGMPALTEVKVEYL